MKYKTKLIISFLSISLLAIVVSIAIEEYTTRRYLFKRTQDRLRALAGTIASQLDGDLIAQVKTTADEDTEAFKIIRAQLQKAREANQRTNIYVRYVYTIYPNPENPRQFLFGIDSADGKDFSPPGSVDPEATSDLLYNHLHSSYTSPRIVKDPWGVWITGYAPIFDSAGNYVGSVGIDLSAKYVYLSIQRLFFFAMIAFFISAIVSTIISLILAKKVTKALDKLKEATIEIRKENFSYRIDMQTKDEFQDLALAMNLMNQGLEERERLKIGFSHYVSQYVMEKIIKEKGALKLEGEKKRITVLFSDIRNFTHLSESMDPTQIVAFLNEYFELMIDIIFKNNGMLDKLIGDGIMCVFGAPLDDPKQEEHAITTAIEMQQALNDLHKKWEKEGKPLLHVGIGIHTGDAIIGSIGSSKRMQYTAIGDTVNVASRLEHISIEAKFPIIISETTYTAIKLKFPIKDLGPQMLHGREKPIHAYAIDSTELLK